jgi:hypothetical protein
VVGFSVRNRRSRSQSSIAHHRTNQNFRAILDGDMEKLVTELQEDEQARLLTGENSAV